MQRSDVLAAPAARGKALFESNCAQCHGIAGRGEYLGPTMHPPEIAGAALPKIVQLVRRGGKDMPAFSKAALPDAALDDLGWYVHTTLGRPADEESHVGPRTLDPLAVGLIVWGALALLAALLALVFGGGRNG
ncbi:MAG: c-type cytochrome [Acidimicrobiales bacterium]